MWILQVFQEVLALEFEQVTNDDLNFPRENDFLPLKSIFGYEELYPPSIPLPHLICLLAHGITIWSTQLCKVRLWLHHTVYSDRVAQDYEFLFHKHGKVICTPCAMTICPTDRDDGLLDVLAQCSLELLFAIYCNCTLYYIVCDVLRTLHTVLFVQGEPF